MRWLAGTIALAALLVALTLTAVWLMARYMRFRLVRAGVPVIERRVSRRPVKGDLWLYERECAKPDRRPVACGDIRGLVVEGHRHSCLRHPDHDGPHVCICWHRWPASLGVLDQPKEDA